MKAQHDMSAREQGARPEAGPTSVVDIGPGESFDLVAGSVRKRIGDTVLPMLAYNGSIPGPTLRVRQGSEVLVTVHNEMPTETTVHWHGLRLENRYDGVPHETQQPIPPGGDYTHRLTFPDAGVFWYHPHVREDYAQELGLYGNVLVEPADAAYWPAADRVVALTLDDILIEEGAVAPFGHDGPNFAAMGRFGNVLLVSGSAEHRFAATRGEVVRLCLTNTANTRVFKAALPGVRMKLIGGDSGRYETEEWVDDVIVAPSERTIVDVVFPQAGRIRLEHSTPDRTYELAAIDVGDAPVPTAAAAAFDSLRSNADMAAERRRITPYLDAPPDKTLGLTAQMDMPAGDDMGDHVVMEGHDHHAAGMSDGIEWEDSMLEMNRTTTSATMHWKIVDRDTGLENSAIDWEFAAGDQVKIRLVNEVSDSDHPMHHPFHIHGERFLVLARDGAVEPNLVWKDTVLVRMGETVDILMDASNPGVWMAHCHIPEHMGSGMMFDFAVRRAGAEPGGT